MQWKNRAAALCAGWALACAAVAGPLDADFERQRPSADARQVAQWIADTGNAGGRPYLIVDKKAARVFVFGPGGRLLAETSVLLGAARGDHSAPGVGERAQTGDVAPSERTTPAGRYVTQPGRNLQGEHVIWIDYESALALHRLRPGRAQRVRAARLESPAPHERRVTLGCVVVPVAFYLDVIQPLLGSRKGVVYVLPETQPVGDLLQHLWSPEMAM